MTPVSLTSSDLSNTKPAPLGRAKQLAATLLSERSEASGALVARQLHEVLRALDADDRHSFQRYLVTVFQPDKTTLRTAAERYLADTTAVNGDTTSNLRCSAPLSVPPRHGTRHPPILEGEIS